MNEAVVPAHSRAMRKNCSSAVAYHPPAHDACVRPEILSVCLRRCSFSSTTAMTSIPTGKSKHIVITSPSSQPLA